MNIYLVLLQLAGAVALLLYSARMVRTGMERAQRPRLLRFIAAIGKNRLRGACTGLVMAVLLQSSTAVAMLAAGFAASGQLAVGSGLAIMLGADFGSALVVQVLSLDLPWLPPLLLTIGALLFFKGPSRPIRQAGRIMLGVSLLLLSLQMIASATLPLRDNAVVPAIAAYLANDLYAALIVGALSTWLLHSSIASILLIATIAVNAALPLEVGVALVLGANIGSALIAFGLTRAQPANARRVVTGNLIFKSVAALIGLAALIALRPELPLPGSDVGRQILAFHLVFNGALVLACLPLVGLLERLVTSFVRDAALPESLGRNLIAPTCLDPEVTGVPGLALASATRELLRMAELVELMLQPLMELYETGDRERIRQARLMEAAVDRAQADIKTYLSRIDYSAGGLDDVRKGQELSAVAVNLEYVGDAVAKTLLRLAEVRRDRSIAFSPEGWRELNDLHLRVMANIRLALNVLVSRDVATARMLMQQKDSMRSAIDESYRRHFERLRAGGAASVASSNIHLETLRTLKSINSHFASIGHPILARSGELLDSRLSPPPRA